MWSGKKGAIQGREGGIATKEDADRLLAVDDNAWGGWETKMGNY